MLKISLSLLLTIFAANALADDEEALPPLTIFGEEQAGLIQPARMQDELDRADLQAGQMTDLNNVLKNQPGLVINQANNNMMSAISMRGAGGAGQGLFTLDGVPLFGNFAGFFSLSHYPLDALDNVTISRGASGEKYGSRTLGGAVHLHTRKFKDGDNFLHLEGGSYDTLREAAGGGISTQAGDFSAVAGHSDIFNGISQARIGSERDNFGMTHASGNWTKNFEDLHLNASLYFIRSDEDTDGPAVLPNKQIAWSDDKKGRLSQETWVSQLRGDYDINNYWNSSLQLGFTQSRQTMVTTLVKPFALSAQFLMVDWKNSHRIPLDAGSKNQALISWGVNTQHQNTPNFSVAQTVISPNIRGELVLDDWEFSADGRFDHGDVYGDHQVFSLSANHALSRKVNIWVNGGTGYRQPGITELMNPLYGDKNLRGESNAGGELGVTWQPLSNTQVRASGYYQKYRDLIVLQLNYLTGVSKAGNVKEADVWGTEMQLTHRWSKIWETGLTYSYMNAVDSNTNLPVAIRPEHQGVFWNEVQLLDPLKLRVELNAHDAYWLNAANTSKSDSAMRVNASFKYQLTPKTELYLRGENLNNDRAAEITRNFGFNGASVYAGFRTGF